MEVGDRSAVKERVKNPLTDYKKDVSKLFLNRWFVVVFFFVCLFCFFLFLIFLEKKKPKPMHMKKKPTQQPEQNKNTSCALLAVPLVF